MLIRPIKKNAPDKKISIRQFPSPEHPYIAFPSKNLTVLDISRFTFCKVDYNDCLIPMLPCFHNEHTYGVGPLLPINTPINTPPPSYCCTLQHKPSRHHTATTNSCNNNNFPTPHTLHIVVPFSKTPYRALQEPSQFQQQHNILEHYTSTCLLPTPIDTCTPHSQLQHRTTVATMREFRL